MSEIDHTFWGDKFEPQQYQNIDVATLKESQEKIKDMVEDVSKMQQTFEYICDRIFGPPIKGEKPEEATSEVQNNIASTTSREQLEKQVTDSTPSEIDNEKSELMNKYLQFDEIMYQDEIIKIRNQIEDCWSQHYRNTRQVQLAVKREYFTNIISLINNFLKCEDEVLKFKIEREEIRTKVKPMHVELINMSREIDHDKCKLLIDNRYLQFVEMIRKEEIKRIFVQLQTYRNNMPNKQVDHIKYKNIILQRIETIKNILGLSDQVIDFNLQLKEKATNVETNDVETSNMSNNADNLRITLQKNNKNLWYLAKTHQKRINKVYNKLERYCNNYCTDDVEETNNVLSGIDEEGLTRDNKNLRSFARDFEAEFNKIYKDLLIHCNKYAMSNKNVPIVMHTEGYDPVFKINNVENKLKKENEYLAFVAMMHLEKMREILFFFEMFRKRFCDTIEEITKTDSFLNQQVYMTNEISFIKEQIAIQKELLDKFAEIHVIKLR